MRKIFTFEELGNAPLLIDAIYEGGNLGNIRDDPLSKIFRGVGNQGGFRVAKNIVTKNPAFAILYTSGQESEWPDFFDYQLGTFKYYGDNRNPGHELHDTTRRGNQVLRTVYQNLLGDEEARMKIPPFLIFRKVAHERARSVSFLGLAVPGRQDSSPGKDLIAVWRTRGSVRFQNYEAYFTVLNTGLDEISKDWLESLRNNNENSYVHAPEAWRSFIKRGLDGISPLKAPKVNTIRKKREQLPKENDKLGWNLLNTIYNYFTPNPYAFESFAVRITKMMDINFNNFELTRPWRDGGRDAIGNYTIGFGSDKLMINCALEAKCYNPDKNSCGIKLTSRLISRIKYREFGVFVTTSWVHDQAYKEIKEDRHPILIISGGDIINILREHDLNAVDRLKTWLKNEFMI